MEQSGFPTYVIIAYRIMKRASVGDADRLMSVKGSSKVEDSMADLP